MVTQSTQQLDTTIRVSVETRNRLVELGKKDDTYEVIIKRLLDLNEKIKSKES